MMPSSVLLVPLQLCCLIVMMVSMPTCKLPGNVIQPTHALLEDMGDAFPAQCRQFNGKIQFPAPPFSGGPATHPQCHWTSLVVYESLRGAELIFLQYELPKGEGGVTWDEQKLEQFRNLQDRLVQDHLCVSIRTRSSSGLLSPYFNNVTAVVEQTDSAVCGWESLRRDLLKVLKVALHRHHSCFNWTRAH
uniref:Uncharacterized protein n=1 Tax=Nothobranchius furzeri TaxID=105023 RepID=A0A8C6MG26_NOTFU